MVINVNDAGPGSLRAAIISANTTAGADVIQFNIPLPGVQTILPLSQLPALTDPTGVFIDGYSQPGSSPGPNPPATANILIELDGGLAGAAHGLVIQSPTNTIQGLAVNNFEQDGIRLEAMPAPPTLGNHIVANFIGTTPAGTAAKGNGRNMASYWAGVDIQGTAGVPGQAIDNWIQNNLISGNYAEGVAIASQLNNNVALNHVEVNNYIGTDLTGTVDLGNSHDGVYIGEGAHDNFVILNVISGNNFEGVCIIGYHDIPLYTDSNLVASNIIGLDVGLNPLPNTMDGVSIGRYGNIYSGGHARLNHVQQNTIAWNLANGVSVWEHGMNAANADGNTISQNDIYDNGLLGIDLGYNGVTPNDLLDPDAGANQEVNFPVITQALYCAGHTWITGTVAIDTNPLLATVEIFKAAADPSGFGEGAVYLGATTPNAAGAWTLNIAFQLQLGDLVTATTTDTNGNTSEFCALFTVVALNGCGDLNGDGATDAADVLLMAAYLAGTTGSIPPAADLNYDAVVDSIDLALLQNVVAGNL